ncbi:MAG: DnaJ domain-containing protein [Rickettsiaceae bacterium H1]|nr:DnaJ domain-containing protein [Rickettsiaceae bacterium H1]
MNSGAFTETFNSIMEKMMSGVNPSTKSNNISSQEALEVLGLSGNPTSTEINKAYHKLMQSIHPDKGGSSYLAQKINLARDTLLKKHKV